MQKAHQSLFFAFDLSVWGCSHEGGRSGQALPETRASLRWGRVDGEIARVIEPVRQGQGADDSKPSDPNVDEEKEMRGTYIFDLVLAS